MKFGVTGKCRCSKYHKQENTDNKKTIIPSVLDESRRGTLVQSVLRTRPKISHFGIPASGHSPIGVEDRLWPILIRKIREIAGYVACPVECVAYSSGACPVECEAYSSGAVLLNRIDQI